MAKSTLLKGKTPDIINANVTTLKNAGYSHAKAVRCALCHSNKGMGKKMKSVSNKMLKHTPDKVHIKGVKGFNF